MNNDRIVEGDIGLWALDKNKVLMIYIPKSLDATKARCFRGAFEHICQSRVLPSRVTLDFSRTSFLDSGGIGALASIINLSRIAGINLTASGITPQVHSVLKMTRLDRLLSIEISEIIDPARIIEKFGESSQSTTFAR
jgi:anti-anti-sigma factor